MLAAVLGSMSLEAANRDLRKALPTGSMARPFPDAWSLETVENLQRFTNLRVIFAQGPC